MKKIYLTLIFVLVFLLNTPLFSSAAEITIGDPVLKNGMKIVALYVRPAVKQDDYWGGLNPGNGVVHLEADIHAIKGNIHGFSEGDWMPYVTVNFRMTNLDTGKEEEGMLWQMVAVDGPHYGKNIKLIPGKYRVILTIHPPSTAGFARHIDKSTGVAPWWEAFELEFKFNFPSTKNTKK